MVKTVLTELVATWTDYRECGDLGGHVRAFWRWLTGQVRPDDTGWRLRT